MPIVLGGKDARFQRVHGDIVASYQYINGERALALWPKIRKMHSGAFIICDSSAWKYNPDYKGSDQFDPQTGALICGPLYLMQQAKFAARVMGMDETKSTVIRIATVIAEALQDLTRLPPHRPEDKRKAIGEATLLVDGKPIVTREV